MVFQKEIPAYSYLFYSFFSLSQTELFQFRIQRVQSLLLVFVCLFVCLFICLFLFVFCLLFFPLVCFHLFRVGLLCCVFYCFALLYTCYPSRSCLCCSILPSDDIFNNKPERPRIKKMIASSKHAFISRSYQYNIMTFYAGKMFRERIVQCS